MKIYSLSNIPYVYEEIKSKLLKISANSNNKFLYLEPLWNDENYFVQLPYKLNEDVKSTISTHPGMSPSHYSLATKGCNILK